jgi:TonB family protein
METYFNYIIESGISLGVFTLLYWLLFRKEVQLKANRIYLLVSVLFSTMLPFLTINLSFYDLFSFTAKENNDPLAGVTLIETITVYASGFPRKIGQALISIKPSVWFYIVGASLALFFLLAGIAQLISIIRSNRSFKLKLARLIVTRKAISPYSFFNFIFINRDLPQQENWKAMVHHELEHVRQGHSFDVLFIDFMMVFQWFNPFYWIIRRMVRENHEFLADRAVIQRGNITAGNYKALLLSQAIGGRLVMTSNFFSIKTIQKRFKMITKNRTGKYGFLKYSAGIVVALAITILFACEKKTKIEEPVISNEKLKSEVEESLKASTPAVDQDTTVYIIVEQPAVFKNDKGNEGDLNEFRNWVNQNLVYPAAAAENGIQGKVYIQFAISKLGQVVDVKILRGVDPILDNEAIRVIKSSPKWKPAMQSGKTVKQQFVIPVNFVLQ